MIKIREWKDLDYMYSCSKKGEYYFIRVYHDTSISVYLWKGDVKYLSATMKKVDPLENNGIFLACQFRIGKINDCEVNSKEKIIKLLQLFDFNIEFDQELTSDEKLEVINLTVKQIFKMIYSSTSEHNLNVEFLLHKIQEISEHLNEKE